MTSNALAKRQSENALMPPPPPPKRIKRPATVLDEDIYTDALSHIIARDFFPGLLETQVKQEYLDALDSKDKEWIASARKKLQESIGGRGKGTGTRNTPNTPRLTRPTSTAGETPIAWGGETPMSVASTPTTDTEERRGTPDVSNMSLISFQAKYTSEDNESFNKLLDKQNLKRRAKHAYLWNNNKIPSARQIAYHKQEAKRITEQGRNPDSEKQVAIKTDLDARPANPDSWKVQPDNSLMFIPPSIEDTHETIQQRAEASSRAGPKCVLYQNTRLQAETSDAHHGDTGPVPPSPSISAIKDAIAGRPRHTDSEAGYTGGETPRVNGYAFVDEDEPEAEPTELDENESLALDLRLLGTGEDSTPNPFQIPKNRRREDLHHRMVDRVARNKREEKAGREDKTPVPRFPSSPRLDLGLQSPRSPSAKTLTPAAQKLLQRVGSTPRHARSSGSSGLKNVWTPTPKRAR
ncbi:hypothetical protein ASPZODRAFT_1320031 [Penicilliopsis zonata CBS 506.65]|uniref:Nuclear protein DGCR14 n=1 Tax=Penicilliopsis zonata CBS 506.65 TaxID=1073090 RepID=A0A1L9SNU9_9EURO|nr:hypothetical protein ASPZODRAFT_1320031 [Penicilliopsis zonata CBS 506.65]OJJ48796.1 hypothetical protein ASPZODRAFT_1320031 [Penicilliopsis zonata CBS 506.65]